MGYGNYVLKQCADAGIVRMDVKIQAGQPIPTEGEWVRPVGGNEYVKADNGSYGKACYPVWTRNDRSDVTSLNQVTIIYGPHIAETKLYDVAATTPYNPGTPLYVNANGILTSDVNTGVQTDKDIVATVVNNDGAGTLTIDVR